MAITIKIDSRALDRVLSGLYRPGDPANIAIQARDIIYKRTKSGYGVTRQRQRVKLPALKETTVEIRKRYEGPKGEYFSPRRSNLTFTGQLLKAMRIKQAGSRATLTLSSRRRSGSNLTNRGLARQLEFRGFRFFGLTLGEQRILVNTYRRKIRDRILRLGGTQ